MPELPVLLLPGSLARAATLARPAATLAAARPTRALDVPESAADFEAVVTLAVAAANDLAVRAGTRRVALLGTSFGAQVAQAVVARAPDLIAALVLVAPGAPQPERGRAIARALRVLTRLPAPLARWLLQRRWRGELDAIARELAGTHLAELVGARRAVESMSAAALLATRARLADCDLHARFEAAAFAAWNRPTLLVEFGADVAVAAAERAAVRALHPRAEVAVFPDYGHAAALVFPDPVLARIERWLAVASSSSS